MLKISEIYLDCLGTGISIPEGRGNENHENNVQKIHDRHKSVRIF